MRDGRVYLLTGAVHNRFLGNNIVKQLVEKRCRCQGHAEKGIRL